MSIEITSSRHSLSLAELDRRGTKRASAEEIARRRRLGAESDRLIREMNPLPVPVEDLIHRADEDAVV
jgi:hypothetical protein